MISKEVRIRELTLLAEKLKIEHYREYEMIREMIEVRNEQLCCVFSNASRLIYVAENMTTESAQCIKHHTLFSVNIWLSSCHL